MHLEQCNLEFSSILRSRTFGVKIRILTISRCIANLSPFSPYRKFPGQGTNKERSSTCNDTVHVAIKSRLAIASFTNHSISIVVVAQATIFPSRNLPKHLQRPVLRELIFPDCLLHFLPNNVDLEARDLADVERRVIQILQAPAQLGGQYGYDVAWREI